MKKSIEAAIKNVAAFGDTDIFPYSFEQHAFHDRPDLLQKALEELHKDFDNQLAQNPPQNINTLAPVGFTGFRWAIRDVQLDLASRLRHLLHVYLARLRLRSSTRLQISSQISN